MKKDEKFLKDLESKFEGLNSKQRKKIMSKYYKFISDGKKNKRKITSILKDLGKPEEIAKRELENLNNKKGFKDLINSIKEKMNSIKEEQSKKKKIKEEKKKLKKEFIKKEKPIKKNKTTKIIEETKDEIINATDIVTEHKVFESKKTRTKRIVLKTLGVTLLTLLLFIWLWLVVLFIASIFAYLDGVKLYGLNITLFGLVLLLLVIIILINRVIFKHKIDNKKALITVISIVVVIAIGVSLLVREISKIKTTHDVSDKYTMTRNYQIYNLPSDEKPFYITFNSNYKTKYIIDYDESMSGKIGVEVKYYECYYDFFIKKTVDSAYISLKLNKRDRLSVYIDDLKEGKIYDNDELERYTIKITGTKKDLERVIINE